MTAELLERADLAALSMDELGAMYGRDDETDAAITAECDRRDKADARRSAARSARYADPVRQAWEEAAYAQYRAAEDVCNGALLSHAGHEAADRIARKLGDHAELGGWPWPRLWTGPQWEADLYASEELRRYWEAHPRMTLTQYRDQLSQQEEAWSHEVERDEGGAVRQAGADGAGVAVPAAGPVRDGGHGGPAEHASEVFGPVLRSVPSAYPRPGGAMRGTYATVPALPIVNLELPGAMRDHIPRAEVVLWAGEGSAGKGTTLVWMAVATALQGHHVAVVFPEDDPETAVRPRLEAALRALAGGLADDPEYAAEVFSRIHDLTVSETGAPFVLDATGKTPGGVPVMRQLTDNPTACECPQDDPEHRHPVVRLVIIDPLLACTEGSVASNIGARRVLGPLQQLAKETGATVMLSQHTVPGPGGKPKVAGSQGLLDTVRLCYMITVDRYNAALRVVRVHKSNGVRPDDVRFTLSTQPNGFKSVTWLDQEELTTRRTAWRSETSKLPAARAAQAVQPDPAGPDAAVASASLLRWLDAGGGDVASAAKATGLSEAVCETLLREMTDAGAAGSKRRMANPFRRSAG